MPILNTGKDLPSLFAQQAKATPDAIALEDEATLLTYAELEAKVEDLSARLQAYGVDRDRLVGVLLPRSADYVIACLAALRAGGAFLVLELAYPPELLADVIDDAGPKVIITYSAETSKIREAVPVIALDAPVHDLNGSAEQPHPPAAEDDLERLAFVAYSSGTTGMRVSASFTGRH